MEISNHVVAHRYNADEVLNTKIQIYDVSTISHLLACALSCILSKKKKSIDLHSKFILGKMGPVV